MPDPVVVVYCDCADLGSVHSKSCTEELWLEWTYTSVGTLFSSFKVEGTLDGVLTNLTDPYPGSGAHSILIDERWSLEENWDTLKATLVAFDSLLRCPGADPDQANVVAYIRQKYQCTDTASGSTSKWEVKSWLYQAAPKIASQECGNLCGGTCRWWLLARTNESGWNVDIGCNSPLSDCDNGFTGESGFFPKPIPYNKLAGSYGLGGAVCADGGTAPYAFGITAGNLPSGVTLNPDGTITGTPDGVLAGSKIVTICAQDAHGFTGCADCFQQGCPPCGNRPGNWML